MARSVGQMGKPTLLNKLLLEKGWSAVRLKEELDRVCIEVDGLYPAPQLSVIRNLKSGAKDITTCSAIMMYKLCYALDVTPNDIMPDLRYGIDKKFNE